MKVRIWYQEYVKKTKTAAASHQQLFRMYHSIAGEYDTTKQTPSHSRIDVNASNIQVNEFKFTARDMVNFGNTRTQTFDTPKPTVLHTKIHGGGHPNAR